MTMNSGGRTSVPLCSSLAQTTLKDLVTLALSSLLSSQLETLYCCSSCFTPSRQLPLLWPLVSLGRCTVPMIAAILPRPHVMTDKTNKVFAFVFPDARFAFFILPLLLCQPKFLPAGRTQLLYSNTHEINSKQFKSTTCRSSAAVVIIIHKTVLGEWLIHLSFFSLSISINTFSDSCLLERIILKCNLFASVLMWYWERIPSWIWYAFIYLFFGVLLENSPKHFNNQTFSLSYFSRCRMLRQLGFSREFMGEYEISNNPFVNCIYCKVEKHFICIFF